MDKNVLILAAGKGTRMGPLGEVLPKPLWPLFKTTLLEAQILLWISRGATKIFINIHHQYKLVNEYLSQKYPEVIIMHEPELLDVGGAVHNVAKEINYQGKLWIANSDVFIFSDEFEKLDLLAEKSRGALTLVKVLKGSKYTNVLVEKESVKNFSKNHFEDYWTYSGLSIVNLNGLRRVSGPSKFFKTVMNFEEEKILATQDENLEYWDFGTLELYYSSLYKLMVERNTQLREFLETNKLFEETLLAN